MLGMYLRIEAFERFAAHKNINVNRHLLIFMQHLYIPAHTDRQTKQMEIIFPPHFNIFSELVCYSKQLLKIFSKISGMGYQRALETKVSPQRKYFF